MSESEAMFTWGESPADPTAEGRYLTVSGATVPSDPLTQRTLTAVVSGLGRRRKLWAIALVQPRSIPSPEYFGEREAPPSVLFGLGFACFAEGLRSMWLRSIRPLLCRLRILRPVGAPRPDH